MAANNLGAPNGIEVLPAELWTMVFAAATEEDRIAVMNVCQFWRNVVINSSFISNLQVDLSSAIGRESDFDDFVPFNETLKILQKWPRSLKLTVDSLVREDLFHDVLSVFAPLPNLTRLELDTVRGWLPVEGRVTVTHLLASLFPEVSEAFITHSGQISRELRTLVAKWPKLIKLYIVNTSLCVVGIADIIIAGQGLEEVQFNSALFAGVMAQLRSPPRPTLLRGRSLSINGVQNNF